MKRASVSTDGSQNRLSYLTKYDEILRFSNNQYPTKEKILPRKTRWFIYVIFIVLNIVINFDHGTIPEATADIKHDLDVDDNTLGLFGSLVFLGNLLGSLFSFSLINHFNRKYLLLLSILLAAGFLYVFTVTSIVWILFVDRIVVGIFQAFISIYLPVWYDQFGIKNKKALMLALIQIGSPLGVVSGFFITAMIKDGMGWKFTFILQALVIVALSLVVLFIPEIYFSSTLALKKSNDDSNGRIRKSDDVSIYKDINAISMKEISRIESEQNRTSSSIFKNLCVILKQKVFLLCAFSLSSLFFVITAIQYWASDYMQFALNLQDEKIRLLCFSIVCVSSPTLGVLVGGFISHKTGGYEAKHSILLCLIFAILASAFAIPVPLVNTVYMFIVFLWLVLFFGGAILPPLTGIIITTLPIELRGSVNSITSFFSNLFGYLPAPFVYALIKQLSGNESTRLAMYCVMYYSLAGVILLSIACILRYRNFSSAKKSEQFLSKKETRGGSLISNEIAKVFGNYLNLDKGKELASVDEDVYDDEDRTCNEKVNSDKPTVTEISERGEQDELSTSGIQHNKTYQIKNPNANLQTPNFNILSMNQTQDATSTNNKVDDSNIGAFSHANEEESLFGAKKYHSPPQSKPISCKIETEIEASLAIQNEIEKQSEV